MEVIENVQENKPEERALYDFEEVEADKNKEN